MAATASRRKSTNSALIDIQHQDRQQWRQQRDQINQQIQALIDNQNQDRQQAQQRSAHLDQ